MSQSSAQQGSGDVLVLIDTSRSELSVIFCCLHPCPSVGAYFEVHHTVHTVTRPHHITWAHAYNQPIGLTR